LNCMGVAMCIDGISVCTLKLPMSWALLRNVSTQYPWPYGIQQVSVFCPD